MPWGQLPIWLAEMVMAPEALQQSGVVGEGVGVGEGAGGVVRRAVGGERAAVRAGARAACSVGVGCKVLVGWVPAERVREDGEVGQVGRGARLRAGTADARERVWARGARRATTSLRACVADCCLS